MNNTIALNNPLDSIETRANISYDAFFFNTGPHMTVNKLTTSQLHQLIVTTLDDHKAIDIKDFDVRHLTDVTDHVIVCTATSKRHALTLADKISIVAKQQGEKPLSSESDASSEWILIDFVDVVVHIMLADTRDFYSLEKLWSMTESTRQQHG